jgi:two-component system sensor histidine kinase CreC
MDVKENSKTSTLGEREIKYYSNNKTLTSIEIQPPALEKPSSQIAFRVSKYVSNIQEDEIVYDKFKPPYNEAEVKRAKKRLELYKEQQRIRKLKAKVEKEKQAEAKVEKNSLDKKLNKAIVNQLILYLLITTTIFSIFAIVVIIRHRNMLISYTTQLAQGVDAPIPKTRLREFSEVIKAVYTLQDTLKDKDFIEENTKAIRHELRNPIIFIANNAETLRHIASNKDELKLINNILLSTSRMKSLLDGLLDLSKLHRKQGNLNIEKLNPKEEILHVLNDPAIHEKIKNKNIQITIGTLKLRDLENNRIYIPSRGESQLYSLGVHNVDIHLNADKLLLSVCLSNIITNAIDFSSENNKINILIKQHSNDIAIEVIDEGKGLPPYLEDKIYDSFTSTERPDGAKSSGLGLSIVKTIMDLHSGKVRISNRPMETGVIAKLIFPK